MAGRDLGTYHVRVILSGGRGWIERWETGRRYTHGGRGAHPLTATALPPVWDSEDDLLSTVMFMFLKGDYSCACNRVSQLARAEGRKLPERDNTCLGELPECDLRELTAIRPDGTEVVLYRDWAAR